MHQRRGGGKDPKSAEVRRTGEKPAVRSIPPTIIIKRALSGCALIMIREGLMLVKWGVTLFYSATSICNQGPDV